MDSSLVSQSLLQAGQGLQLQPHHQLFLFFLPGYPGEWSELNSGKEAKGGMQDKEKSSFPLDLPLSLLRILQQMFLPVQLLWKLTLWQLKLSCLQLLPLLLKKLLLYRTHHLRRRLKVQEEFPLVLKVQKYSSSSCDKSDAVSSSYIYFILEAINCYYYKHKHFCNCLGRCAAFPALGNPLSVVEDLPSTGTWNNWTNIV